MELQGIIKKLGDVQTFASGFQKREMVIVTEEQYPQPISIEFLKEKGDLEITFKSGKDKFVLTDEWLIDKMLNFSFSESDYNSLMGGDIDLNRKAEKFSYTDASSVFFFFFFKYYKRNN